MEAIWNVTYALQDSGQMENGLSKCLTILAQTIKCENGFIWMHDDKAGRLCIIAASGRTDVTGISVNDNQGILGRVYREGSIVTIDDCMNDTRFKADEDEETGMSVTSGARNTAAHGMRAETASAPARTR